MKSRDIALNILRTLHAAGYEAWLVGGCVRDELRGVAPKDFDIATNALPEQVESLFPKTIGVGKSFGVMLVLENDQQGALMVPTEVLAEQHYKNLIQYLNPLLVSVELLTGNTTQKKRRETILENKEKAELTSFAYYECAEVNAVVKGGKIISVIEEIKIFE